MKVIRNRAFRLSYRKEPWNGFIAVPVCSLTHGYLWNDLIRGSTMEDTPSLCDLPSVWKNSSMYPILCLHNYCRRLSHAAVR